MNLWAKYVKERLGWDLIEIEGAFIAYELRPPVVILQDIYVEPELRGQKRALSLTEKVERLGIEAGCRYYQTSVWAGVVGSERSLKATLDYGFKLISAQNGCIVLQKDIGGEDGQ